MLYFIQNSKTICLIRFWKLYDYGHTIRKKKEIRKSTFFYFGIPADVAFVDLMYDLI